MLTIELSQLVTASPEAVWADLSDISTHAQWMSDAEEIIFHGDQRQGRGTRFDCVTKVGPIRMTDRMEVIQWVEGSSIGIRHKGIVSGTGFFELRPRPLAGGGEHTEFAWIETLRFGWHLAGPVGEVLGRPVLVWIWKRNLRAFADRFA